MKPEYKFIFDLDGTLYRFDGSSDNTFLSSRFYGDLKTNINRFFVVKLGLSPKEAKEEYERLKKIFNGEVSLGVEKEYGIDRYEYFNQTWNLKPQDYLRPNPGLVDTLAPFANRSALLTAAPRIWALSVLRYLGIENIFGDRVFTGEPNIRKPDGKVFRLVSDALNSVPEFVFSIGDQEFSDILPAQGVGMKTVLIGTPKTSTPDFHASDIATAIKIMKKEGVL